METINKHIQNKFNYRNFRTNSESKFIFTLRKQS